MIDSGNSFVDANDQRNTVPETILHTGIEIDEAEGAAVADMLMEQDVLGLSATEETAQQGWLAMDWAVRA
jgi:hypothetical protein